MIFRYGMFNVFINIHEYASYANTITYTKEHGMKGIFLNFNLVQILVVYDKQQLRYD